MLRRSRCVQILLYKNTSESIHPIEDQTHESAQNNISVKFGVEYRIRSGNSFGNEIDCGVKAFQGKIGANRFSMRRGN